MCLLQIICLGPISFGTETTQTPTSQNNPISTPAEEAIEVIEVIAPTNIASQVENIRIVLKEMEAYLASETTIAQAKIELPATLRILKKLESKAISTGFLKFSIYKLDDLQRNWDRLLTRLTLQTDKLNLYSEELTHFLEKLEKKKRRWQKTNELADTKELPKEVQARIVSVLNKISEVEGAYQEQFKDVLTLQDDIIDFSSRIDQSKRKLGKAIDKLRAQRFTLDNRPIWSLKNKQTSQTQYISNQYHDLTKSIVSFYTDYHKQIILHIILFVIISTLTVTMHRKFLNPKNDNTTIYYALQILHHPIIAAILVCLIFTGLIYPDAPIVVYRFNRLLGMLAAIILLPTAFRAKYKVTIYCFITMCLVSQVNNTLFEGSLLQRFTLLALNLLALITLTRLSIICYHIQHKKTIQLICFYLCNLYIALLTTALISNIIGAVSLANLLVTGVITSTFGVIAIYLCAVVLIGLCWFVTKINTARKLFALQHHRVEIRKFNESFIWLLAGITWLWGTLKLFDIFDPIYNTITVLLSKDLMRGKFFISTADILSLIISFSLTVLIARIVQYIFEKEICPRISLPRGVANGTSRILYYMIILLGIIGSLASSGFDYASFAFIIGGLGVGIGFGFRNLAHNFISGLVIIFQHPIQIGDKVEVASQVGIINRIGILSTTLQTFSGAEVIMPNGNLTSKEVVNWTLSDHLQRIDISVEVPLKYAPDFIQDLLHKSASENCNILHDPPPKAFLTNIGSDELSFELCCWVADERNLQQVRSDISTAIYKSFHDANIWEIS